MKAHFLFAVAENDDQREPDAKTCSARRFAKAKLPAEIEVYAGAAHGWCPPDSAVYNETAGRARVVASARAVRGRGLA